MLEIERLRQFNESKEHWQVRKEFLLKNWEGRKSTDSLVSLSWCYSNMMVLGANYPPETIAKINEMLPQKHKTSSSEPKQNAKLLSFTTTSMVNAASGTLMVKIANTFKEFEIEGFKSKFVIRKGWG